MAGKFGLGKGAEALFTSDAADDFPTQVLAAQVQAEFNLPLDKILANPNQPRKNFDETALEELAASIRENGVIQPIIVEESGNGNWTIIAGERRSRAAKLAGLSEIPAIVKKFSDDKKYAISLIENIQRADLNPIEEAAAYKQLMDMAGISQDEAAARVGKNRSTLANALRLLKLPDNMQQALAEGTLTAGHARAILSLNGGDEKQKLFAEITSQGLSVRDAEKKAAEINSSSVENEKKTDGAENPAQASAKDGQHKKRDPELDAMQQRFMEKLGTKINIDGTLEKGVIRIEYYTMDDLDRINEVLSSNEG
ncbi:chromosome partitioning protein ParB [Spirochaetia bacterium]|nr:chromosome partitioning protein ParB [Spirochaetia bacterium]